MIWLSDRDTVSLFQLMFCSSEWYRSANNKHAQHLERGRERGEGREEIRTALEAEVAVLDVEGEVLQVHLTAEVHEHPGGEEDVAGAVQLHRLTGGQLAGGGDVDGVNPVQVGPPQQLYIVGTQLYRLRGGVIDGAADVVEQGDESLILPVLPEEHVHHHFLQYKKQYN